MRFYKGILTTIEIGNGRLTYVARVVNEPRKISALCSVYNSVLVDTEHVAASDALRIVQFLSKVSN